MNERMTEAELLEAEEIVRAAEHDAAPLRLEILDVAKQAVAEVRRLRGLLKPFSGNVGYDTCCIGCGDAMHAMGEPGHSPECPWIPLEAEASAIRAEE